MDFFRYSVTAANSTVLVSRGGARTVSRWARVFSLTGRRCFSVLAPPAFLFPGDDCACTIGIGSKARSRPWTLQLSWQTSNQPLAAPPKKETLALHALNSRKLLVVRRRTSRRPAALLGVTPAVLFPGMFLDLLRMADDI